MIINTDIKNPQYNQDGVTIDVELNHPVYGWIPFTATPYDTEPHGKAIYQAIINGQFGPIGVK